MILQLTDYPRQEADPWTHEDCLSNYAPWDVEDWEATEEQLLTDVEVVSQWGLDRFSREFGHDFDEKSPESSFTNWEVKQWCVIVNQTKKRLKDKYPHLGRLTEVSMSDDTAGYVNFAAAPGSMCLAQFYATLTQDGKGEIELGHSNVEIIVDVVSGVLHGSCEECEFSSYKTDTKTKEASEEEKQDKKKRRTVYGLIQGLQQDWKDVDEKEDYGYSKQFQNHSHDKLVVLDAELGVTSAWDERTRLWVERSKNYVKTEITNCLHRPVDMIWKMMKANASVMSTDIVLEDSLRDKEGFEKIQRKVHKVFLANSVYTMAVHELSDRADYFKAHLDSNQDELPILGGNVINLQTGQVRERTIHDLWSCELPVTYTNQESFPHVEKFMKGITNYPDDHKQEREKKRAQSMMDFHQQRGGYFLTGHTTARLFWSDLGEGMNGKSALFAMFKAVLGPLYLVAHKSLLIKSDSHHSKAQQQQGPETQKVALKNPPKRLAVFQETSEKDKLDMNEIKPLVDDNEIWISARDCHQKAGKGMEFRVYAKFCIPTNNMLKFDRVPGDNGGVDRSQNVPWPVRFEKTPEEVKQRTAKGELCKLANRQLVSNLKDKYLSEFFSWLVKGAMEWYKNDQNLPCPEQVRNATRSMLAKNDKIQGFIDECCELGDGLEVTVDSVYSAYDEWFTNEGSDDMLVSKKKFGDLLCKDKGCNRGKDKCGNRVYQGIGLKE
jgi:phage/plasmid-associated DNA primase